MGWKKRFLDAVNSPLRLIGARLVPLREHSQMIRLRESPIDIAFQLGNAVFEQFAHRYNCGWPCLASHTERSVELAVAERWLNHVDNAMEIGAVTPYYWPRWVSEVVDPTDGHKQVTRREGIESIDLSGRSVLSISTFEHIGSGDYGLQKREEEAGLALDKLFEQSPRFLITFASGYNSWLDEHTICRTRFPKDVELRLLVRNPGGIGWTEREPRFEHLRPYSSVGGQSVFFLHRGTAVFE